jgi:ribose 5-phosphate isomerase B
MVCGSGVGASVACNKVPGVRAALSHDTFSARQGVEDDDVNVLCLGARVIGSELAFEVIAAFLKARFSGAERHVRRRDKVTAIETHYRGKA